MLRYIVDDIVDAFYDIPDHQVYRRRYRRRGTGDPRNGHLWGSAGDIVDDIVDGFYDIVVDLESGDWDKTDRVGYRRYSPESVYVIPCRSRDCVEDIVDALKINYTPSDLRKRGFSGIS